MAKPPVLLGTDQTWPVEIPAGGHVDVTASGREFDEEGFQIRLRHTETGELSEPTDGTVVFADETPENLVVEVTQIPGSKLLITPDPTNPMRFRIERAPGA